jgi:hypothetical protein
MNYKQCRLEKKLLQQTVWLPTQFCILNKIVKIKDDDGWIVKNIYKVECDEKVVVERSRDYTKQRIASDI